MRLAVFSESDADEAAVRLLVEGLLGRVTDNIAHPALRSRGWPSVLNLLPVVLKNLHYHTDAEALALVVDSDDSQPHALDHAASPSCRFCRLSERLAVILSQVTPVVGRPSLKVAIGLAVPAIEAWYLCGKNPHVSEAAWIQGQLHPPAPYDRNELKEKVYGTDRPTIDIETVCARAEAARLASNLRSLDTFFPAGFGSFARAVRSW